ncbi:MAG: GTP cyclohydrolase I FolE2 [Planctomycetes bacterium]|nr:GTP cyclohydrolase I FolE2 [Planctomycetota bacterium]
MEDVQGRGDVRGIRLECAGVTDVRYPATAIDPDGVERSTIVKMEMSVVVPPESKGTHMSRFIEIVQADDRQLGPDAVLRMLREMQSRLHAAEARLVLEYPMFMEREAPVSKSKGMIDIDCGFVGLIDGDDIDLVQKAVVTVTSLCPCSKEISDYGAHNQRGAVTVEVRTRKDADGTPVTLPMGDLIFAAEESASCRIYPVLKRPDERWITMEAYENPVFVEDMVRGVAERLQADERIVSFRVHARNFESIHGHDAFAETSWSR